MIELVIVIAILGILAAVALPRFANFSTQAQSASRTGVVGDLNTAIGIVHAQWIAGGSTGTTVSLDGGISVTVNASGYPDVGTTYNSASTCQTLVNDLLTGNSLPLSVFGYAASACTISGSGTGSFATPISMTDTAAN